MKTRSLILGVGCTPVGELWDRSLYDLGVEAVRAAMDDAGIEGVDALIVGNMLSGVLNRQENLAACLADRAGLRGVEAAKVEAGCASGAAALRLGDALIASGACRRVVVLGVEKMTDSPPAIVAEALAFAADFELETAIGASFTALAALLTSLYSERSGATPESLSAFVLNAHRRAVGNPWAMFPRAISRDEWAQSPPVADPIRLLDCPPICDGAAAVVLVGPRDGVHPRRPAVEILAVEGAVETVALGERRDPLRFEAAARSIEKAVDRSGLSPRDVDLFEMHDAFPVLAALSIEAAGLMPAGEGWRFLDPDRGPGGDRVPIQTMGGLKGRGHPVGATGIYQVVEAVTQLRGGAWACQVPGATTAMTQSFGGLASNVFTTILRRSSS